MAQEITLEEIAKRIKDNPPKEIMCTPSGFMYVNRESGGVVPVSAHIFKFSMAPGISYVTVARENRTNAQEPRYYFSLHLNQGGFKPYLDNGVNHKILKEIYFMVREQVKQTLEPIREENK